MMKKQKNNWHALSKFIHVSTILVLLLCSQNGLAQGWIFGFSTSTSDALNSYNDVPYIPGFNGENLHIAIYAPDEAGTSFQFISLNEDGWLGLRTQPNPAGWQSGKSHIPVANYMLTQDSTLVLTQEVNSFTGRHFAYLGRYYKDTEEEFPPPVPGTQDWHRPLLTGSTEDFRITEMSATADDQFILAGTITPNSSNPDSTHNPFLLKFTKEAHITWFQELPFPGEEEEMVRAINAQDGGYWVLINTPSEPWILKTDALGNMEWEAPLNSGSLDRAEDITLTSSGGVAITGQTVDEDLYVMLVDEEGIPLWRQTNAGTAYSTSIGRGIIEDVAGHLVIVGNAILQSSMDQKAILAKFTSTGIPLWERTFGQNPDRGYDFLAINKTPSEQYLMGGRFNGFSNPTFTGAYIVKTDTLGLARGALIRGNVFHDLDMDCQPSPDEIALEGWIVRVNSDSLSFHGVTNENGDFQIPVVVEEDQEINYTVSVTTPSNYWESCVNNIGLLVQYQDTLTVDFPMQSLVDCPALEVEASSYNNFRLCDTTRLYFSYCNRGTVLAEDASVEVTLPSFLTFVSASIEPSSITDSTYTFALGDVDFNNCGSLTMDVEVICGEEYLGQEVCVLASIFPDTICTVPGSNWSGALLAARYECTDGDIQFQIENVGTESMAEALEYVIIEDAVLLMQGTYDLDPTQIEFTAPVPQGTSLYTLLAQQEPGAPGAPILSVGAGACVEGNSTGLSQFDQNDGDPFTDIFCEPIVGPYDPNDKQAKPVGFGPDHGIHSNTDIEYTIRFQNVGTDTAFRVIIRDTIAEELDLSTLQPLAASHPYSWRFEDRTLVFSFYNIALPDSTTNPQASQGFISFKISQHPDLPVETRIENTAEIYFDFNSPIVTNTTFHTVKKLIDLVSGSVVVAEVEWQVKVMPNPVQQGARIKLEGDVFQSQTFRLHLYDMMGKQLQSIASFSPDFWLDRGSLPSGIYLFRIDGASGPLASGKLMMQ
ncbi:MAG: T9SS type A sorting domain-containing protein [Bacteroidota bacterium]